MGLGDSGSARYSFSRNPAGASSPFIKLRSFAQGKVVANGRKHYGTLLPSDSHILLFFLFNCSYDTGCCSVEEPYIYAWSGMRMQEVKASIKRLIEARCITKIDKSKDVTTFLLHPTFWVTSEQTDEYDRRLEIFDSFSPISPDTDFLSPRKMPSDKIYMNPEALKKLFESRRVKLEEECIQELKDREKRDQMILEHRRRNGELSAIQELLRAFNSDIQFENSIQLRFPKNQVEKELGEMLFEEEEIDYLYN